MSVRVLLTLVALTVAGCAGPRPEPVRTPPPPVEPEAAVAVIGTAAANAQVSAALGQVLAGCRRGGCGLAVGRGVEVEEVAVEQGSVVVRFSRDLGDAPARPATVAAFQAVVTDAVRGVYPRARVRVETRGDALAALIPNAERPPAERDAARVFAPPVTGPALVRPADADRVPPSGPAGRHVALWPSHG